MKEFSIFRTYNDQNLAKEIDAILRNGGIITKLVDNSPSFDVSFANNKIENEIQLLISPKDFEAADELLEKSVNELPDKEHYLYSFTTEELYEVLARPDEWNPFDYKLSQKILLERGEEITPGLIQEYKYSRIKELEKPEKRQIGWIITGYIFSFLGGFIGILIGWFIANLRKTLPDGRKVSTFQKADRLHGRIIFFLGIMILTIVLLYNLINSEGFIR